MSITLSRSQMLALIILAFVTILVLSVVTYSAVAHINVWHSVESLIKASPDVQYGGH